MSTTPVTPVSAAPVTTVATAKVGFWKKIESWFHKVGIVLEADLKAILDSTAVKDLEAGLTALAKTDLGQIASVAVTEAMNVETGVVNFTQAYQAIGAQLKSLGKSFTDSAITAAIAAAQQKVQQISGTVTTPVPAVSEGTKATS